MGGQYEVKDGATKKYYSIAGMMVAVNDGTGLQYLLTDHLGSTVAVTNSSGTLTSQQRYLPFGGTRAIPNSSILGTEFGYTGQRLLDSGMGGIMDYKARLYSPALERFVQPDTIIPDQSNPQSWNRYSYVENRPVNLNDPTGNTGIIVIIVVVVTVITIATLIIALPTYGTGWDPEVPGSAHQLTPYNPANLFNSPVPTNTFHLPRSCPNMTCYDYTPTVTPTVSLTPTPPDPCPDSEFCWRALQTETSTVTPTSTPTPTSNTQLPPCQYLVQANCNTVTPTSTSTPSRTPATTPTYNPTPTQRPGRLHIAI
jgi:RHS repeat-associated protein